MKARRKSVLEQYHELTLRYYRVAEVVNELERLALNADEARAERELLFERWLAARQQVEELIGERS